MEPEEKSNRWNKARNCSYLNGCLGVVTIEIDKTPVAEEYDDSDLVHTRKDSGKGGKRSANLFGFGSSSDLANVEHRRAEKTHAKRRDHAKR